MFIFKNLLKSFAGESQARNRYTYFSSIAKKEGYVQIAAIFEATATQEKEHAKRIFKFLEGHKGPVDNGVKSGSPTHCLNWDIRYTRRCV